MATILQIPSDLELAGNIPDIILSSAAAVNFKIIESGVTILEENYDPDANNTITIRLRDLLPSLLVISIPDTDVFEQTGACKTFSFVIDGASTSHTVVSGGVNASVDASVFLKANWLTWQLQQKKVKYTDPEWLAYYAAEAVNVKLKAYFKDADPETITLTALGAGKLYSLNVNFQYLSGLFASGQPVYFDIWTEDATAVRLSFVQRYVLFNDFFEHDDLFVFANSLGGIDTIRFTGKKSEENKFDISRALFDEDTMDYDVEFDQVFSKNTGYFSDLREKAWINEFFNSARRYSIDDGNLKSITISDPQAKVVHGEEDSYYYEFKFALSCQTNYLNLPRTDELPEYVEIIDPDSEVFFLAPRLLDFPLATLDNLLLFPVQSPFVQEWKRLSYGAIKSDIISSISGMGFITGGDVPSYIDLSGYATLDDISVLVEQSHTHQNKADLDKLSVSDGYLNIDSTKVKAGDSDKLGGIVADNYYHTGNANKSDVSWTMANGTIHGYATSPVYASGFAGSGWRIDPADNRLTVDYLTVRKAMDVYELVVNQIRGTNGSLWVSDAAKVKSVTDGGNYWKCFIDTDGGNMAPPFAVDDWIRCQKWTGRGVKYYSAKVTSVGADYFNLTKTGIDGAGVPEAGDTVVRIGNVSNTARQGSIYLTASDNNSPYLDVLDGVTSGSLSGKTKVRLGKLDGITDAQFGPLSGYGFYGDNVYVKGVIYVTGGNAETLTGAQTKANAAQSAAEAYALAKANLAETQAKAYADGVADAAEQAAINAAQAKADAAELAAKAYADGIVTASEQAAIDAANAYADAQDVVYETTTKAYADGIVSDEEARAIADAQAKADAAKAVAISTAATDATTKANSAQSTAISTASGDATTKANNAQAAAQGYASGLVTNLQNSLGDLAFEDLIGFAKLDSTIIQGGYIKSTLLDVNAIRVSGSLATTTEAQGYASSAQSTAISTAAADATNKVNAVEIGGRNLFLNSDISYTNNIIAAYGGGTVAISTEQKYFGKNTLKIQPSASGTSTGAYGTILTTIPGGNRYTYSFLVYSSFAFSPSYSKIMHEQVYPTTDSSNVHLSTNKNYSPATVNANTWTRVTCSFDVPNDAPLYYFRPFIIYFNTTADYIFATEFKLEKGNKATAWNPAPEDVEAYTDTAKASAISTAATDATTKATAAQTAAQTYASGLVNALSGSLGDMAYQDVVNLAKLDDTIIQGGYIKSTLLDVAAIKVSGSLASLAEAQSYATTAQTNAVSTASADATAKVNAVQVGGTNLITKARIDIEGTPTSDSKFNDGTGYYKSIASQQWRISNWTFHEVGNYSLSFWAKATSIGNLNIDLCDQQGANYVVTTNWTLIKIEKKYINSQYLNTIYYGFIDLSGSALGTLYISNFKLESGDKCTAWSPAPEDVSAYTDTAKASAISAAATDATTKANNAQSAAQTYADGLAATISAAKQDAIVNGQTLIIGGYLNTAFIQAGAIVANMIASTTITGDKIAAGTIDATKINATALHVNAANVDGTLVASQINFDGASGNNVNLTGTINAASGTIGGFSISNSGIVNDTGLAYVICRNTSEGRDARIGSSVFPLGGSGVSYFQNTYNNPYANNYAVYAYARNAGAQFAGEKGYYAGYFDGHVKVVNGDLEVSGQIAGIMNIPDSHISHLGNSTSYNYMPSGYYQYVGDTKTADRNYYLPYANAYSAGAIIRVANWNANNAYLYPRGSDSINGYGTSNGIQLRDPADCVWLRSNGSNQWMIIVMSVGSGAF